jgi:phage baseplate assembly protein V
MLRFGNITEIDAAKGRARVHFEEDGIVSDWLPMVVKSSQQNKHESWYDVGDFVACMMDEHIEDGVIVGAIYDDNNAPPIGNKDVEAKTFSDGTVIKYDRSSSTLTVECVGDVIIQCVNASVTASGQVTVDTPTATFTGDVNIQGGVSATGNIETQGSVEAIGDVVANNVTPLTAVHLITHMHPTAAPGSPSPPTPGT